MCLAQIGGFFLSNKRTKMEFSVDQPLSVSNNRAWIKFVDRMNLNCTNLGLEKTNFVYPYSNNNLNSYTTGNDAAKLGLACLQYSKLLSITQEK